MLFVCFKRSDFQKMQPANKQYDGICTIFFKRKLESTEVFHKVHLISSLGRKTFINIAKSISNCPRTTKLFRYVKYVLKTTRN